MKFMVFLTFLCVFLILPACAGRNSAVLNTNKAMHGNGISIVPAQGVDVSEAEIRDTRPVPRVILIPLPPNVINKYFSVPPKKTHWKL